MSLSSRKFVNEHFDFLVPTQRVFLIKLNFTSLKSGANSKICFVTSVICYLIPPLFLIKQQHHIDPSILCAKNLHSKLKGGFTDKVGNFSKKNEKIGRVVQFRQIGACRNNQFQYKTKSTPGYEMNNTQKGINTSLYNRFTLNNSVGQQPSNNPMGFPTQNTQNNGFTTPGPNNGIGFQGPNGPIIQAAFNGGDFPPFVPVPYVSSVQEDVRLSFAADLNPLIQQKGEFHWRSFIATVILIIGLVIPLIIYLTSPEEFTLAIGIAIPVTAYILYLLIGCICNELHEYLRNIQRGEGVELQYERVRGLSGQFDFTCECYHYETRHHVRHRNGRTEHYTTQQKVISRRDTQTITPANTTDASGNLDRIRAEKNIIFIHFIINYRFANDYSRNKIDQLFYNFKRRNAYDSFQNFNMVYNIPTLVDKMAFYVGDLGCNYNCWYYVFAIIGLLWPYSMWVESKINRFDVSFMKVVTM